jgi:hypothetical protein
MIGLTQELSPMKTDKKLYLPKPDTKLVKSVPPPVRTMTVSITSPARPHHSVTFAPIVESRSPSPPAYNRAHLAYASPDVTSMMNSEIYFLAC